MTKQGWVWYVVLGVFYLGLLALVYSFHKRAEKIRVFHVDTEVESEFEGNDFVTWKNTPNGVVAERVHPLPRYKPYDKDRIEPGYRLRSITGSEILDAEVIDKITKAGGPGMVFVTILERPDLVGVEEIRTFFRNGFRLSFSFNTYAAYWHVYGWIAGFGAFMALIMLAILLPIARGNWREFLVLLGVVVSGLLFFALQLVNHMFLIIESDLEHVGFQKIFILGYVILLFVYAIYYLHFKSGSKSILFVLPSVLVGGYFVWQFYEIIFIDRQLKFFHDFLENYSVMFFLAHIVGGILLVIAGNWQGRSVRRFLGLVLIAVLAGLGIWYFADPGHYELINKEHIFFGYKLMLFFPLVNAAFLQLQFGKVSLVVTQTIQYLVFFIISIIVYLLVIQLFDYLKVSIEYRKLLEFVTFVILIVILRFLYLGNEDKFRKYFVTAKREKLTRFKSFIARIPQYTSSRILRKDLVDEMMEFFNTETVHLWWKGDEPESGAEKRYHEKQESIYEQLTENNTVWSKTKEITPFRLDQEMEKLVLKSDYTLICPVTVDQDNYALLMLGKKRRGVYNLGDLELISQLIQQTQLTLNVLQLVSREKDLIQQTYEANLTALRSQINPHFLFNTLNSIGELVHESADLAEEAVEKLAFIFRYTLDFSNENFVSLSNEIRLISTYLDLEKIRFGDRLNIHIDIDPKIKETQIPAFILSTLVENCIKHGISKILHKGKVSVVAFPEDDFLICEVVDNGPGIDLTRINKSHGLSNSIARLENIYDIKNLLYFENTGEGTYVKLKIPLVKVSKPT